MRRYLWHLHPVNAVILLADMLKVFFPVHSDHRPSVLIQIQKAPPPADYRLNLWLRPVLHNLLKALIYIIRHRENPGAGIGFRVLNISLLFPLTIVLLSMKKSLAHDILTLYHAGSSFSIFGFRGTHNLPATLGLQIFAISADLPFPSCREEYPMPVDSVLYSFRS